MAPFFKPPTQSVLKKVCRSLCAFLLVVTLSACFEEPVAPIRNIEPTAAPEFSFTNLYNSELSSAKLKGNIVVLNFWATWSPACAKDLPVLMQLQTKYLGKVQVVGIALGEHTLEDAKKMAAQIGLNFPVTVTPFEFHQSFGGIDAVPSTFIIDANWQLVNRYTGRIQLGEISAELDYMLNEAKKKK